MAKTANEIKMNIEFERFAYVCVCVCVVDRIWKLKYGARIFCMPYEMFKVEGFGNSFGGEALCSHFFCFEQSASGKEGNQ